MSLSDNECTVSPWRGSDVNAKPLAHSNGQTLCMLQAFMMAMAAKITGEASKCTKGAELPAGVRVSLDERSGQFQLDLSGERAVCSFVEQLRNQCDVFNLPNTELAWNETYDTYVANKKTGDEINGVKYNYVQREQRELALNLLGLVRQIADQSSDKKGTFLWPEHHLAYIKGNSAKVRKVDLQLQLVGSEMKEKLRSPPTPSNSSSMSFNQPGQSTAHPRLTQQQEQEEDSLSFLGASFSETTLYVVLGVLLLTVLVAVWVRCGGGRRRRRLPRYYQGW